ncbi:MAG: tRNA lysidine(34) synthetase TilS [Acidobacteria bacterium RIFCSPLOWO2_02_FULL_67_36]|nr:MAG: tRNA lysidine(34) synthetase TilS [Acidobacteria bacterium RIFCSPLOWO2_02_FULL_67_36]OFW19019.1 MAG: tRNA lysidine(34) synthetase TilS [Acidobacteria bacterium RIFCSPLOWO2_12_FULL_66_21]
MSLPDRVLRTVRKYGLVERGGRVVAALSGGPDSVALVHLLRELQDRGELTVAGVAHFNHQLRGAEADADEAFCAALAADLGLAIEIGRGDVRAFALDEGRSIEDAARQVRYAFLNEAADRLDADVVAVGHSRDDQAETFLLRLLRGSGPRGLAAILPRAGRIVRPLLDIPRADLREYLRGRAVAFREDATNADVSIPRNRVRHELLPYLERDFSPGIVEVLAREAAIARADEDRLQAEAIEAARSSVSATTGAAGEPRVQIDRTALTSVHPALAVRVARLALGSLGERGFIGFEHLERFLEFAREAGDGAVLSLPGRRAVIRGRHVVLDVEPNRKKTRKEQNSFRVLLSIPGEVTLERMGWAVSAERLDGDAWPGRRWLARAAEVPVSADALHLPLAVRCRRDGDRFRPLGLGGRAKKLQDFLVDRKIPRETRDLLPLVVDADDRIVWVVGQSIDEDFRVTEPSQGVLLLKARRLGGLG